MSTKAVLVSGGTGFIGTNLVKLLSSSGYDVTIVSRMPGTRRITWHELENKGLPQNTVAVVNVCGQNVLDPTRRWSPGLKQNVWTSRVNSAASLVKAIENAQVKPDVFINLSGIALYKPDKDKVYTEDDAGEEYDFMSKLCVHWEKAATLADGTIPRQIRIRSGAVIGDGGMIKSMKLPFWFGLGGVIGDGKQQLPWIHIDDLCNLIKFGIENENVKNVLNGVAPQIITNEDFTKAFAQAMRRPALFKTPEFVINLVFGAERAVIITTGPKIEPKRVLELGFKYKYPNVLDACKAVC